jgi:hypothetical protein
MRTPAVHDPYTRRTPCQQPMKWPLGGFGVAIGWLSTGFGRLCPALRGHRALFLLSTFCFLLSLRGGLTRPFCILHSAFCLRSRVFTISILNTPPLSRLPRGGLGAPWYHPGHVLYPQNIPKAPFLIRQAYPNHFPAAFPPGLHQARFKATWGRLAETSVPQRQDGPRKRQVLPVDIPARLCQRRAMLAETKNQHSLTRAASSSYRCPKREFLSVP